MRTIGLDVAVQTAHKAVVLDEQGHFCTPLLTVHTRPSDLDQLLGRARDGAPSTEVQIVMEPTSMAWFPASSSMRGKRLRSIWSTVRRWPISAATISATPKAIGSTRACWPVFRWSTPTSSTA